MLAVAEKLSLAEFEERYGKGERSFEYWQGRAIPKAMPTSIHGKLQIVIGELLRSAGYDAGSEIELRIVDEARLTPDVVAVKGEMEEPYPTRAMDVVVEILSADDAMGYVIEKCRAYQAWGFAEIYVVDPESRLVFRWTRLALEIAESLASVPTASIWERLDRARGRRQE